MKVTFDMHLVTGYEQDNPPSDIPTLAMLNNGDIVIGTYMKDIDRFLINKDVGVDMKKIYAWSYLDYSVEKLSPKDAIESFIHALNEKSTFNKKEKSSDLEEPNDSQGEISMVQLIERLGNLEKKMAQVVKRLEKIEIDVTRLKSSTKVNKKHSGDDKTCNTNIEIPAVKFNKHDETTYPKYNRLLLLKIKGGTIVPGILFKSIKVDSFTNMMETEYEWAVCYEDLEGAKKDLNLDDVEAWAYIFSTKS